MYLPERMTELLVYGGDASYRYTQDSPVLADVWIQFGLHPREELDLLITPRFGSRAGKVSVDLREALDVERTERGEPKASIAYNQVYVAATMSFPELVRHVMPRTGWWAELWTDALRAWGMERSDASALDGVLEQREDELVRALRRQVAAEASAAQEAIRPIHCEPDERVPVDLLWLLRLLGAIGYARDQLPPADSDEGDPSASEGAEDDGPAEELPAPEQMFAATTELLKGLPVPENDAEEEEEAPRIWLVNINRKASTAVSRSRKAIKADAAHRLFHVDTSHITWAIIDSGIDATHPAFFKGDAEGRRNEPKNQEEPEKWYDKTRVTATYDFTCIRHLLDPVRLAAVLDVLQENAEEADPKKVQESLEVVLEEKELPRSLGHVLIDDRASEEGELADSLSSLKQRLVDGRPIDWDLLDPFLCIKHDDSYQEHHIPKSAHGTHVAGILAANWHREGRHNVTGVCPDIRLYDMRVLDPGANNDEFAVLAALQFTQWLNSQKDFYAVHGVNLSLSIPHAVANFACGRTPVCDQCAELIASGVLVVAAAGNDGYLKYQTQQRNRVGTTEGYNTVSITDPGNAAKVITVGSTHRYMPHTYGVSYFSSRGPTGDGRLKPDIVAPGEKIWSVIPGSGEKRMDGTSMAAPHVSGAAAMVIARHAELVGQPDQVKKALCDTATDLGREKYFQGAGMLDVLRALQSI